MDLQMLVNGILASSTSSSFDINQDGKVDVLDLQRLVNVILGIQSCPGQGGVSPQIEGVRYSLLIIPGIGIFLMTRLIQTRPIT